MTDGQTQKKMRGGVFSKNIWERASERRNENIIVSGTLKNSNFKKILNNNCFIVKKIFILN